MERAVAFAVGHCAGGQLAMMLVGTFLCLFSFFMILTAFGHFWLLLAPFWQPLAACCNFWQLLATFGTFWKISQL